MSPFSHVLQELRLKHNIRQVELADLVGYDQTYISALEVGLKGPPPEHFVDRVVQALELASEDASALRNAAAMSERRVVIDADMPHEVYALVHEFRAKLRDLTPTHVRVIREVLRLVGGDGESWPEVRRRLRRRTTKEEAAM